MDTMAMALGNILLDFFFPRKVKGPWHRPLFCQWEREYHIIYQLLSIYRICIFSQFKYICLNCNYKIKKKKKKNVECNRDSLERPLVNIYKFRNFDNIFLVVIGFRFLKLRCMLHVLLKRLLLLYLKKLIRTNKLLSL